MYKKSYFLACSLACLCKRVTPFAFQSFILSTYTARRSLIIFPSNKAHLTPRSATRRTRFSLQQCIYCTYRRNGSKLPLYMLAFRKRNERRKYLKSWRVNLRNRGKVKVIFLPSPLLLFPYISPSLSPLTGSCRG